LDSGVTLAGAGAEAPGRIERMQIAEVVGTVVSTQKNRKLEGAKLLLVQPLTLEGAPRGTALLAIDSVGAGVGEKVLVVIEGKAAGDALGKKAAAVDAAIIGIVDAVEFEEDAHAVQ
jgi:microcompartment protein CcmK/EutM